MLNILSYPFWRYGENIPEKQDQYHDSQGPSRQVARSSAVMLLNLLDKHSLAYHEKGIHFTFPVS